MHFTEEELKDDVEHKVAFIERIGLKALEIKPRYVKLTLPLKGNENHLQTMIYAGGLFTLAEMPGGVLFMATFVSKKYYPIVKEMTIKFLLPAETDVFIEMSMTEEKVEQIQTEAEKNGKADYIIEGEIKNTSGQVVAVSKGTYQMRAYR
jgi:acyl-coenzyme A thioesterase PaaI-like protein